jgi:hypothetical protein
MLVVAAAIVVALFSGTLRHQIDLSVKRQPESYASLYFTSPGALPSDLPTEQSYPVAFTVANHDVQQRLFRYEITLTSPGDHQTSVGTIDVPSEGTADTTVKVTPKRPCAPCKVVVALPTEHAAISFSAGDTP